MSARGDVANDILNNGELIVQRRVVEGWKRSQSAGERLVVFDVGANIGNWSTPLIVYMSATQENAPCDIHLFEPVPDTFATLQDRFKNAETSANLHFHQLALSSDKGVEQMYLLGASGINSIHSQKTTDKGFSTTILKETVSEFCIVNAIKKIHLLKCDTEGHDMEVIQGALPLLEQNKIDVLQFEYNHCWIFSRHYLKDVFDTIADLPYRLGKIQSDCIELYREWHPEMDRFFEANYVLIHHDSLSWFSTHETYFDASNTIRTENS